VVQDLVAAATVQSGMPGGGAVSGLAGRLEGYALRGADRVAVVSETFRPEVEAYGVAPERVVLLPNWTHIAAMPVPRDEARARLGWRVGGFSVVHTGNMGLKQDLGNVIEAARLLVDRDDVTFYLVGHGSQRGPLRRLAVGLPNVRFVDPLDAATYPLALAAADVLLVNERPTVGVMSLPSKLTSYLSAGRPVLAAVWPGGATGRELDRTRGAALRVDPGSPAHLAGAVEALDADPAGRARMGEAARSYADARLGRARAMARLDQMLSDLLSDPSHQHTRGTR
jgi:colanic acid biosynthesis glycosyl transferase WcaI